MAAGARKTGKRPTTLFKHSVKTLLKNPFHKSFSLPPKKYPVHCCQCGRKMFTKRGEPLLSEFENPLLVRCTPCLTGETRK